MSGNKQMGRLSDEQRHKAFQVLRNIENLNKDLKTSGTITEEDFIKLDMYANFFYKIYIYKHTLTEQGDEHGK